MPAHNEAMQLSKAVEATCAVLVGMDMLFEIIVVDDHSTDATLSIAQALAVRHVEVIACSNTGKPGKGAALRFGFAQSSGEYIMFLDADLDLHPSRIPTFLSIMDEANADIVVGSKQHVDSNVHYPFRRRVISLVYRNLVRALFRLSVRDTQTGMKLFRRNVLQAVLPETRIAQYAQDLEILVLAKRNGFVVVESPVELSYHAEPTTSITMGSILRTGVDTLRIWFRFLFH